MELNQTDLDLYRSTDPAVNKINPIETLFLNNEIGLAEALCRKALMIDSYDTNAIYYLGRCFIARGAYSQAEKVFRELMKIENTGRSSLGLADSLYQQDYFETALDYYFEASLLTEDELLQFEIFKSVGNIYVKLGSFDLAEDFYHKAYSINPQSDSLLVNYGTLAIQKNQQDEALRRFRQAITINSKNDKAWVGLAMMHIQRGDYDLGFANLQMAVEANPNNKTALQMFGMTQIPAQKLTYVVRHLVRYLEQESYDADLAKVLINFLTEAKLPVLAKLELKRAQAYFPENKDLITLAEAMS